MIYAEGKILECTKQSFTDDGGSYVEYFENDIRVLGGELISVNSKVDFTECVGREGILGFALTPKERAFKLTLREFRPGESFNLEEAEIA